MQTFQISRPTICPPGLAVGINRFNSPRCAEAVAAARRDRAISRWLDSVNGHSAKAA